MKATASRVTNTRSVAYRFSCNFLFIVLWAVNVDPLFAVTLDIRVSSSSDDAEERPRGGVSYVSLTSTDLEMSFDRGITQNVGVRFTGLDIPQGRYIENAYIQFTADEINTEPTDLTIALHNSLYSGTFREDERLVNGNRPRVSTTVPWSPTSWDVKFATGIEQRTPDLSQMIQELVDRERFGNTAPINLAFIISGVGERTAVSYDKIPDRAALLHIEYSDQPVNQAPFVDAGFDSNIDWPYDTVPLNAAEVIDDGLPDGTLLYNWEVLSSSEGGTVTFEPNANIVNPNAVFSTTGIYELRLTASDGVLSDNDSILIYVDDGVSEFTVAESRISSGSDDAEENDGGFVSLSSSDLELVANNGSNQTVGMRFTNVAIPRSADINWAYVQFTSDEIDTRSTQLYIQGENTGLPSTFSATQYDISNRPVTSAIVNWSPVPWTAVGKRSLFERTPNITSIIQEIVNRDDWQSGNSLALIVTGTGSRTAEAFDGSMEDAPLLWVQYR